MRAAIVGEVQGTSGIAAARAAVLRFEHFVFHEDVFAVRKALPMHEALAEMERCAGRQFDPAVVRALAEVVTCPPLAG